MYFQMAKLTLVTLLCLLSLSACAHHNCHHDKIMKNHNPKLLDVAEPDRIIEYQTAAPQVYQKLNATTAQPIRIVIDSTTLLKQNTNRTQT